MKATHLLIFSCALIFSSCATSSSYRSLENTKMEEETVFVQPAGVDSLTAVESNELADSSFVSYEKQQEAESLKRQANAYSAESNEVWEVLAMEIENNDMPELEDDTEFVASFNEGASNYTEAIEISQSSEISEEDLTRYSQLVTNAIDAFEEALKINPYYSQTRVLLAQLYSTKANRFNQEENYEKAIDILEKLVRVEKGEHVIFFALGENYYMVGNYKYAAENFEKATEILHQTIPLSDYYFENETYSPEDSTMVFNYEYYTGLAHLESFNSEEALQYLRSSLNYASAENEAAAVESDIEFINWDDGNILGSMRRDSLAQLAQNGQLEDAESGFLTLRNELKTESAQDEIEWRLGVVQYQLGKEDQAADRLLRLVEKLRKDETGAPLNQDHQVYFRDFGTILYNLGMQNLENNNNRVALNYFNQSTKVKWENRARSNLRIADLLKNNVSEAIKHAEAAENEIDTLNDSEKKSLYNLLTDFHRRNGNLDLARNYQELWRGI